MMVLFLVCMILCSKFDRQHCKQQTIRYGDISFSIEYLINHHNCRSRSVKQGMQCNIDSIVYYIYVYLMLCVNKIFTSLGNSSPSPNIEENTTTAVPVWLLKCTTTHSQNIVSLLFVQLILHTPHYWITYLDSQSSLTPFKCTENHFPIYHKTRVTPRSIAIAIRYKMRGSTHFLIKGEIWFLVQQCTIRLTNIFVLKPQNWMKSNSVVQCVSAVCVCVCPCDCDCVIASVMLMFMRLWLSTITIAMPALRCGRSLMLSHISCRSSSLPDTW